MIAGIAVHVWLLLLLHGPSPETLCTADEPLPTCLAMQHGRVPGMHAAAVHHSHAAISVHTGIQGSHNNLMCILAHYLHENSAGSSAHHLDGACTYNPAQNLSLPAEKLFIAVLSLSAVKSFPACIAACRKTLWLLQAMPTCLVLLSALLCAKHSTAGRLPSF